MNNSDQPASPVDIVMGKSYDKDYDNSGLTKREHFAAMAMQGFLSLEEAYSGKDWADDLAKDSIQAADALLAALSQSGE